MEKENIAVLVMLGVFIAFNTFIYFFRNELKPRFGFLESISDMVYVLKGPWVMLFSLWCILQIAPLAMFIETSGLFFIPMVLMCLLATTPYFKIDSVTVKHIIGATGSIFSAVVVIWIVYGQWWWILVIGGIALLLNRPKIKKTDFYDRGKKINALFGYFNPVKNYTTFLEQGAVLVIIIGLWIR